MLDQDFFARSVHEVAPDLIGCTVEHAGSSGVIVETEAYHESEPACHAFAGITTRNALLFGPAGHLYVYLSYGIHSLLNFVTGDDGVGEAVLIRALEPVRGIEAMRKRRALDRTNELCSGPGKLTQALGIGLEHNGSVADDGPLVVRDREANQPAGEIVTGERIGITKATDLPWRYCLAGSAFVSRPRPATPSS